MLLLFCDENELVTRFEDFHEIDDVRVKSTGHQHLDLMYHVLATVSASASLEQELGRILDTGRSVRAPFDHSKLAPDRGRKQTKTMNIISHQRTVIAIKT